MKESQHTEWKESWRDEYLRWVCGFANAEVVCWSSASRKRK